MTRSAMTAERVRAMLAAYGSEKRRWPAHERDAAQALIDTDPSLAADLVAARDLDATLALHPEPPALTVNPLMIAATARKSRDLAPSHGGPRMGSSFWARAASLAAAAVLGFAVGVSGVARGPAPLDPEDALALLALIEEDAL